MIRINLEHNRGFRWYEREGVHVKGYLFEDGQYLSGHALACHFSQARDESDFLHLLARANGCFSVVANRNRLLMASDLVRTFPLFYARSGSDLFVSDNAAYLAAWTGTVRPDPLAFLEFRGTGYVTGRDTLWPAVHQVQAGEMVWGQEQQLERRFYSTYRADHAWEDRYETLCRQLGDILDHVFERLLDSLQGRSVVIPLSGGYDSRLIAAVLRKHGYPEVFCYTYGRAGNRDIEPSERTARQLGYPWTFIEYTEKLVDSYLSDPVFQEYYRFSANSVSMFFLQEYFAVKYLKESGLIREDAVFVPGHSGDFIAGSMFLKHGIPPGSVSPERLARKIFSIKYAYTGYHPAGKKQMLARIRGSLQEKDVVPGAFSYSVYEDWDIKEKFAKFIVNSCNVYDWFGYQYRLPFWDRQLVEFFRSVPFRFKVNKKLYDEVLLSRFLRPAGLDFGKEIQPAAWQQKLERARSILRKALPASLAGPDRNDPLFYREVTGMMVADLQASGVKTPVTGSSYNSVIVQWYLNQVLGWFRELTTDQ